MPVPGEVAQADRLRTQEIRLPSGGDTLEAYLAQPPQPGPAAGIIVIHEAFGPLEHIHDVARRFANVGYSVVAPNLYSRTGVPDAGDLDSVFSKMFGLDDDQAVADLEATAAYLRGLDGATDKVGVIGFCSGGRQALLAACSSQRLDAAVDCWGGFITRATPDAQTTTARPSCVIDLAPRLHCPLYAVFGANDENPSPSDATELEQRLSLTNTTFQVEVVPDAGHAFFADYRPSYVPEAAHALWPRLLTFFEAYLR